MKLPRFSLRALFIAVGLFGLGLVVLINASDLWASAVFTVTLCVLFIGVVGSILSGPARAYWIGFTVFGWGYLWIAHWPTNDQFIPGNILPRWRLQTHSGGLLTTHVLEYGYKNLLPLIRERPSVAPTYHEPGSGPMSRYFDFGGGYAEARSSSVDESNGSYPYIHNFMRVGHSLWAMLFAFVGAWIGGRFHPTTSRADAKSG